MPEFQYGPSPALLAQLAGQTGQLQGTEQKRQRALAELNQAASTIGGAFEQLNNNKFRNNEFKARQENAARDDAFRQKEFDFRVQDDAGNDAYRQQVFDASQKQNAEENTIQKSRYETAIQQQQIESKQKQEYQDKQLELQTREQKTREDAFLYRTNPSQYVLQKNAQIDDYIEKVKSSPALRDAEKIAAIQTLEQQRPAGNREKISLQQEFEQSTFINPLTGIQMQRDEKNGLFVPVGGRSAESIQDQIDAKRKSLIRKDATGADVLPSNEEVYKSLESDLAFAAKYNAQQAALSQASANGMMGPKPAGPGGAPRGATPPVPDQSKPRPEAQEFIDIQKKELPAETSALRDKFEQNRAALEEDSSIVSGQERAVLQYQNKAIWEKLKEMGEKPPETIDRANVPTVLTPSDLKGFRKGQYFRDQTGKIRRYNGN